MVVGRQETQIDSSDSTCKEHLRTLPSKELRAGRQAVSHPEPAVSLCSTCATVGPASSHRALGPEQNVVLQRKRAKRIQMSVTHIKHLMKRLCACVLYQEQSVFAPHGAHTVCMERKIVFCVAIFVPFFEGKLMGLFLLRENGEL